MAMGDWNHFLYRWGPLIICLFAVSRSLFPNVSYEISKPWRLSDWIAGTYHLFPPIVQKSMSVRFQICQCHSELWSIIYHAQGFLEQSHLDSLPPRRIVLRHSFVPPTLYSCLLFSHICTLAFLYMAVFDDRWISLYECLRISFPRTCFS